MSSRRVRRGKSVKHLICANVGARSPYLTLPVQNLPSRLQVGLKPHFGCDSSSELRYRVENRKFPLARCHISRLSTALPRPHSHFLRTRSAEHTSLQRARLPERLRGPTNGFDVDAMEKWTKEEKGPRQRGIQRGKFRIDRRRNGEAAIKRKETAVALTIIPTTGDRLLVVSRPLQIFTVVNGLSVRVHELCSTQSPCACPQRKQDCSACHTSSPAPISFTIDLEGCEALCEERRGAN